MHCIQPPFQIVTLPNCSKIDVFEFEAQFLMILSYSIHVFFTTSSWFKARNYQLLQLKSFKNCAARLASWSLKAIPLVRLSWQSIRHIPEAKGHQQPVDHCRLYRKCCANWSNSWSNSWSLSKMLCVSIVIWAFKTTWSASGLFQSPHFLSDSFHLG